MARRLDLQRKLEELLGSRNVYFQPPESVKMNYPAIRYSLNDIVTTHADNEVYTSTKRYEITVIDEDPDSEIPDKILAMQMCTFDRPYQSDNLNHWVFSLYF